MAKHTSGKVSRSVTIEAWLVVAAVVFTVWLFQSGTLESLVSSTMSLGPIPASLIAGAAYSTFVTTPLAVGGFVTMGDMQTIPVWQIAVVGALGATLVDLLLVRGARSPLAMVIVRAIVGSDRDRFKRRFRESRFYRWGAALLGGFLVAIPLPTDELGVVFFSASGLRALQMVPVIFVADFIGVYAIVSAAQLIG